MKITEKQIAANRRNAAHSTGPRTEEGKQIVSQNALKHGLLAREVVVSVGDGAENRQEFDAMLLDLKDYFAPQGVLEEILVEKIAVAYWRLRRAHRFEVGVIRDNLDNATDTYYEGSYDKDPHKTDEQIDKEIREAEEVLQEWRSDKKLFLQMSKDGKDLQEIYSYEDNWKWLFDKITETLEEITYESPADLRIALNQAGWTDADIWQSHIEVCDDAIGQHIQEIQNLQKEKVKNKFGLQVRMHVSSIPAGFELDRLLKYEGSIEKQFYKALHELQRLQAARNHQPVPPPVAIDIDVTGLEPKDSSSQ